MKTLIWNNLTEPQQREALARPAALSDSSLTESVRYIMQDVKNGDDQAVLDYTAKFDGAQLSRLQVSEGDMRKAWKSLPEDQQNAIKAAQRNIKAFHAAQRPKDIEVETMPGVMCRREARAIETAGLYVPGGTAPLVSTLMMLAIPAKVAGVKRRVVVTPPGADGKVNPAILGAAYRCGVTELYACGGAQAIAAMAYGTRSIPKCDKIFGPGNAYVATAKSLAAQEPGGPAIDMPAGQIINSYAPEHLILQTNNPDTFVPAIRNAGSIFLGQWTPESVGDYASGTNHTLPTYGAARAYSGVTLESFIKYISVQKLTRQGLEALGPTVETLADMEGLEAHRRAVSLRLQSTTS